MCILHIPSAPPYFKMAKSGLFCILRARSTSQEDEEGYIENTTHFKDWNMLKSKSEHRYPICFNCEDDSF